MTPLRPPSHRPPQLRWRRQLDTGLEPLDTQHRQMMATLGRLAQPGPEGTHAEDLALLARDLIRHGQLEETLMREAAFPDRVAHAHQHQDLIRQVRDLQYQHTKGRAPDPAEVARLGAWLDRHIREADLPLVKHLKAGRPA